MFFVSKGKFLGIYFYNVVLKILLYEGLSELTFMAT